MSLKIQAGSPVTVRFPYGDFRQVNDNFNGRNTVQYLYTVEVNGAKDYLYAEEALHELLQGAGVKKGSRLTVTKQKDGKQVTWQVDPVGDPASSPAPPAEAPVEPEAAPKGPETVAPAPSDPGSPADALFWLMARCLRESLRAYQWLGIHFTANNVQATGSTLFIECNKRGIVLTPIPYPTGEQMEVMARIGDAILPDQKARLEKMIASGITWTEAHAIIDYHQERHGQPKAA